MAAMSDPTVAAMIEPAAAAAGNEEQPGRATRGLVAGVRATLRNWWIVGPMTAVVEPSRVPPRAGWSRDGLGRLPLTLRLRNGWQARCRINEFSPFVEVFVRREYAAPGVDMASLRTVVDVGANAGLATLWFAMEAPHARIIAVEPGADVLRTLRGNVRRNALDGRVEVWPVALGGRTGRAGMVTNGRSVLARVDDVDGVGVQAVEVMSLPDLLDAAGIDRVDLLKLDCEGAEYDVLRGSGVAVLRRVGAIVGEYHLGGRGRVEELEAILRPAGFEVSVGPLRGDAGMFMAWRGQVAGGGDGRETGTAHSGEAPRWMAAVVDRSSPDERADEPVIVPARLRRETRDLRTMAMLAAVRGYARLQGPVGAPPDRRPRDAQGSLSAGAAARAARLPAAIATRLRDAPVVLRMRDGATVRCRVRDAGALLSVYVDRDYEIPGLDWASLRAVIDIGAHVGAFTVWASVRAPRARFVVVEPNPAVQPHLLANIAGNGLVGRSRVVLAAVGPQECVGGLVDGDQSLGTRVTARWAGGPRIAVTTLDALLTSAGVTEVDLLKLDCEGAEYDVLLGAPASVLQRVRRIACEYHPAPGGTVDDLERRLRSLGFRVSHHGAAVGMLYARRES